MVGKPIRVPEQVNRRAGMQSLTPLVSRSIPCDHRGNGAHSVFPGGLGPTEILKTLLSPDVFKKKLDKYHLE